MTRPQALTWSILLMGVGGGLLFYLLRTTSPYLDNGSLHLPLVILLFVGIFTFFAGGGVLAALLTHARWPALGGGGVQRVPRGDFALRQGLLLGGVVVALALLAFFQMVDLIFILVILLIATFIESYWQQRATKPPARR